jgi:hypothetical protein
MLQLCSKTMNGAHLYVRSKKEVHSNCCWLEQHENNIIIARLILHQKSCGSGRKTSAIHRFCFIPRQSRHTHKFKLWRLKTDAWKQIRSQSHPFTQEFVSACGFCSTCGPQGWWSNNPAATWLKTTVACYGYQSYSLYSSQLSQTLFVVSHFARHNASKDSPCLKLHTTSL